MRLAWALGIALLALTSCESEPLPDTDEDRSSRGPSARRTVELPPALGPDGCPLDYVAAYGKPCEVWGKTCNNLGTDCTDATPYDDDFLGEEAECVEGEWDVWFADCWDCCFGPGGAGGGGGG